jgi:phosphohistidine swiveling domain-containing protein
VRRIFLEFGRRFVAAGVLESQPDIFYLTLDELRQTAALRPQLAYRTLVSERRADLERFWAVDPPLVLGTPPPAPDAAGRAASKRGGTTADPSDQCGVLRGHAGSAGIARGPARVNCGTDAAAQVGAGEILVAATITPAWTPLFAAAAAVVTDSGGILSHCAIVAREYRIPAVVGTGSASTRIRDGQLLEVDGSAGIVRIVTSA